MRPTPHVAIVVPEAPLLASVGAFVDAFDAINRYARAQYGEVNARGNTLEIVRLTTLDGGGGRAAVNGRHWPTDGSLDSHVYDVVVVAACARATPDALRFEAALVEWLRLQWEAGALVAACGGSIIALGQAGLLRNARIAAPSWLHSRVSLLFPGARIAPSAHVSNDGRLFCSAYPADDLALVLELIERITTPVLAEWLRRQLGLSQSSADVAPDAMLPTADTLVERAKHWLHTRFARPVRIDDLAAAMGVSTRTLERQFTAAEGIAPITYLQRHRIEVAKRMLRMSDYRLDQIAALVGYASLPTFARLFKRDTGMALREWRLRAQSDAANPPDPLI